MKDHHLAWLVGHPERSQAWLQARLVDGFDVHHVDGNHQNNDPANLVLIEHVDHMRMHCMPVGTIKRGRVSARQKDWRRTNQHMDDVRRASRKREMRAARLDSLVLMD